MHRFFFLIALLASYASAATWGTKAFAFHGRIAPSQGAFSLAHLVCMQGTFNRLLMDTPPGRPTEVLVPHRQMGQLMLRLLGWQLGLQLGGQLAAQLIQRASTMPWYAAGV